jgi:AraC-like DNA-binding protein
MNRAQNASLESSLIEVATAPGYAKAPAAAPVAAPRAAQPRPASSEQQRCAGIRPEVLARVLQLIDQRFNEPLRVEDLGRHACLSPFHFARMFKISVGQAPHAYLTTKRMQYARDLLAETSVPIAEVARRVGFRTQAHFSGVFRKQVGVTPGQFRREHRNPNANAPARDVEV